MNRRTKKAVADVLLVLYVIVSTVCMFGGALFLFYLLSGKFVEISR